MLQILFNFNELRFTLSRVASGCHFMQPNHRGGQQAGMVPVIPTTLEALDDFKHGSGMAEYRLQVDYISHGIENASKGTSHESETRYDAIVVFQVRETVIGINGLIGKMFKKSRVRMRGDMKILGWVTMCQRRKEHQRQGGQRRQKCNQWVFWKESRLQY